MYTLLKCGSFQFHLNPSVTDTLYISNQWKNLNYRILQEWIQCFQNKRHILGHSRPAHRILLHDFDRTSFTILHGNYKAGELLLTEMFVK